MDGAVFLEAKERSRACHYAFIGLFFIAAVSFPVLPLVGAYFLRPRRPTEIKLDTYECGLEAIGDIWVQFKVQYYLYALAFVVFDIEVVFLYPGRSRSISSACLRW